LAPPGVEVGSEEGEGKHRRASSWSPTQLEDGEGGRHPLGASSSPHSPHSSSPPSPPPVIYHCYSTLAALLSPSSSPSSTSALPSTSNPSAVRTDVYTLPGLRREDGNEEEKKEEEEGEDVGEEGELMRRRKGKEGVSSSLPLCPARFHIDQCTCNFEIELKGDKSWTSVELLLLICLYVVVLSSVSSRSRLHILV